MTEIQDQEIQAPTQEALDELKALTGLEDIHAGALLSDDQANLLRRMLNSLPDLVPEAIKRLSGQQNRIALPGDRIMAQLYEDYHIPCTVEATMWGVGDDVTIFPKGYTRNVKMLSDQWHHIPPIKIPAPYDIVEVYIPDGIKGKWLRRAVDNSGKTAFQVEVADTVYLYADHGKTWRHYEPGRLEER